LSKLLSV